MITIVGHVCRCILSDDDNLVMSHFGGSGHDALVGGSAVWPGTMSAMLLTSPPLEGYVANLLRRSNGIFEVIASREFECFHARSGLPLSAALVPSRSDHRLLSDLVANRLPAIGSSCVLVCDALSCGLVEAVRAVATDEMKLAGVARMSCFQDMACSAYATLPELLFVDVDCEFGALDELGWLRSRIVVLDDRAAGTRVIVDGVTTLWFRPLEASAISLDTRPSSWRLAMLSTHALAAIALTSIDQGACLEEAVWIGLRSRNPQKLTSIAEYLSQSEEARSAEVFGGTVRNDIAERRLAIGIVIVSNGSVLLAEKEDDRAFEPGLYYLPGGKVHEGEALRETVRRELEEETGLVPEELSVCGYSQYADSRGRLYHFVQFLVSVSSTDAVASDDITTVAWLKWHEIDRQRLFRLAWAQLFALHPTELAKKSGVVGDV